MEASAGEVAFVEVIASTEAGECGADEGVECYVSVVADPRSCGKLLRELGIAAPLRRKDASGDGGGGGGGGGNGNSGVERGVCLGHLKRVRRAPPSLGKGSLDAGGGGGGGTNAREMRKRLRSSSPNASDISLLEVVVGTVSRVDAILTSDISGTPTLGDIVKKYSLVLRRRVLPSRPARNQAELDAWSGRGNRGDGGSGGWWPTVYFKERTDDFLERERRLTQVEEAQMRAGMEAALCDGRENQAKAIAAGSWGKTKALGSPAGVVVMNPADGKVVSFSSGEKAIQLDDFLGFPSTSSSSSLPGRLLPDAVNPLCTSVVLAIQGVSRTERAAAEGSGICSEDFQRGQYLCTGYDVYCTREPDVYESMALVHSRARRVVYGIADTRAGGLGGAGAVRQVHSLPGTNHHYRVFSCCLPNIVTQCQKLHP